MEEVSNFEISHEKHSFGRGIEWCSTFETFSLSCIPENLTSPDDMPALEFGFYCVNWDEPDIKIKKAFCAWVDSQSIKRPEAKKGKVLSRKAKNSERGSSLSLRSQRSLLKSLGAFRLRSAFGLTIEEAQAYSQANSLNKSAIFEDRGEWTDARQKVEDGIGELFES